MAERRMFAKTIIDSDAFLDMPLSTQALYFHLSMRADDDGFINNPKKIQRMVGCGDDDLKLLIAKNFIIPFDSGVVVIKHWKIHNYIRNDRYKETVYQEEKAMLNTKENKAYTLSQPIGIPTVNHMDTQDRIGKESIGKYSIESGEVREEIDPEPEKRKRIDYEHIKDMYNKICISFPLLTILSDKRKQAIKARLNSYTVEQFKELFTKAEASDFLKGKNDKNWQANFDWLIKDANFAKVLDGNYDNKSSVKKNDKHGYAGYSLDLFEQMLNSDDEPPKTAADDENIRARAESLKQQFAK